MSGVDKKLVRAWVRQQAGPAKRAALPVVISGALGTLIGIGQAWCLAAIIGNVLVARIFPDLAPQATTHTAIGLIAAFAALSVLRALSICVQELFAARAGIVARARLRRSVLDSVIDIGPALLRRQHSAEIASLLVDRIEVLDGYFARWLPASMTWMVFPALVLIAVFVVDPRAALILAICGALVPVSQAVFGIGAALASRNQFLAMVRLQARFLDRIRGVATIVLANATDREAEALSRSADDLRRRTMKILRVAFLSSAAIDIAMVAAIILIVLTQGHFVHLNGLAAPSIHPSPHLTGTVFALFLVPEFFAPFRGLALAYQDRAHAAGAAEAMEGLNSGLAAPEGEIAQERETPVLVVNVRAENLSYRWKDHGPLILDGIDFAVAPDDILLLDGPSGAGKSTLIELLLGFIQPVSGRILFNDQDIATMRGRDIARHLAWIGQKPVLFAGTLRDNLIFARPDATEDELQRAIEAAAIDSFLPLLPDGLETAIGEGGFGLSGGQAQRIAIARAYLKDAPLLLLDEPTAHLDPQTEHEIIASLRSLSQGRTVILSSHSKTMKALATMSLSLGSDGDGEART
ncbi:thiol reductant ABC exporter subunit CydD [Asaia krungthepensis]|uniref:Transport ATP-binding protein CydD n=1 Tax=Asaia krungthepensis NRIC 0535 TaxID=1307925 RepID=A0ABQ0PXR6_9PROT|nr:thiol reductant ABC exporter subunit CydD [Asaia krungthepensis]GBQ84188.1 transport ATP-binding protein CydD [Asaia krungthepensis NRIC 0535]